jgi:hypothetical protein
MPVVGWSSCRSRPRLSREEEAKDTLFLVLLSRPRLANGATVSFNGFARLRAGFLFCFFISLLVVPHSGVSPIRCVPHSSIVCCALVSFSLSLFFGLLYISLVLRSPSSPLSFYVWLQHAPRLLPPGPVPFPRPSILRFLVLFVFQFVLQFLCRPLPAPVLLLVSL